MSPWQTGESGAIPNPDAHPDAYQGVVWRRVLAYGVDVLIIGLCLVALGMIGLPLTIFSFGLLAGPVALVYAAVPLAYHTLLIGGGHSATLGMRLFDIEVWSLDGTPPTYLQAFVQTVLFYLSIALTSTLILLVVLFNPRRRTLHDTLAGTIVLRSVMRR
jgi:uncharacterized RDD family membrane protein YckC